MNAPTPSGHFSNPPSRFARALWGLHVLFLVAPAMAQGAAWIFNGAPAIRGLLRGRPLAGVTVAERRPGFSAAAWVNGDFQTHFDRWYAQELGLRTRLVRFYNQVEYSLFRSSDESATEVVVGRDDTLFEANYLADYFRFTRPETPEALRKLTRKLRRLQDLIESRGARFTLLVTPHKASVYPELAPPDYAAGAGRQGRTWERFRPMLAAAGVRFIDGPALTLAARARSREALFCRGGVHWNALGAIPTAQAVVQSEATRRNAPLPNLEPESLRMDHAPEETDRDLADLLNLWTPPTNYPAPHLRLRRIPAPSPKSAIFIGGSFNWMLLELLDQAHAFPSMDFYYYYHRSLVHYPTREQTAPDCSRIDWADVVDRSSLVVLEINEVGPRSGVPSHYEAFARDALRCLESRQAKAPQAD